MAEPDDLDEDLFADLYEGDDNPPAKPNALSPPPNSASNPAPTRINSDAPVVVNGTTSTYAPQPLTKSMEFEDNGHFRSELDSESRAFGDNMYGDDGSGEYHGMSHAPVHVTTDHGFTGTVGIKEDG